MFFSFDNWWRFGLLEPTDRSDPRRNAKPNQKPQSTRKIEHFFHRSVHLQSTRNFGILSWNNTENRFIRLLNCLYGIRW